MKRRNKIIIPTVIALFAAAVGVFLFLDYKISSIRDDLTELEVTSRASSAFTVGVNEAMARYKINYEDIVDFSYDSEGNIKSVQTNIIKLSSLGNEIGDLIDREINSMGTHKLTVPLGTLIGVQFLGGMGMELPVYITMRGLTGTNFTNAFEASGINQTRHQIFLEVNIKTYVFFNGDAEIIDYEASVCIAESIIVGITPETFAEITDS